MRTLIAYGIGVVIVLAILNGIAWLVGSPRLHSLNVFSAGFVLGMLGTCISAYLNGYRKVAYSGRRRGDRKYSFTRVRGCPAAVVARHSVSMPRLHKISDDHSGFRSRRGAV